MDSFKERGREINMKDTRMKNAVIYFALGSIVFSLWNIGIDLQIIINLLKDIK